MTTKELESKLKISRNTCIHCPTLTLAKQVLDIFHKIGLKWSSGEHYTLNHNWDILKKNTVYYPFGGLFSPIKYAQQNDYKIISAKKFIALHTEDEEFNLENYVPKGQLTGFPKEIIAKMLDCQEEQGNPRNVTVFEKQCDAAKQRNKGFEWDDTKEGWDFWHDVITNKNFIHFFELYPKQDSQEFKIGDKVIYYITNKIGVVREVKKHKFDYDIDIVVDYGNNDICEYEIGADIIRPFLLHYRNDYDYSVIDFNNLPKRQKAKRWRAEEGQRYYYINMYFEVHSFTEEYSNTDTKLHNSGNYFQTEKEAQEVADKLKKCFQELINPNK